MRVPDAIREYVVRVRKSRSFVDIDGTGIAFTEYFGFLPHDHWSLFITRSNAIQQQYYNSRYIENNGYWYFTTIASHACTYANVYGGGDKSQLLIKKKTITTRIKRRKIIIYNFDCASVCKNTRKPRIKTGSSSWPTTIRYRCRSVKPIRTLRRAMTISVTRV